MDEIWKQIDDFPDYFVSDKGRIKSIKNGIEKVLNGWVKDNGYRYVMLCKDGIQKSFQVHRLVAMAFIDNPLNKPCVNHIDNCRVNNNVKNLEWVTYKENSQWASVQGRLVRTDAQKALSKELARHLQKPVIGIEISTGNVITFDGVNEVRKMGFTSGCVSQCCRGKSPFHRGYYWFFRATKEDMNNVYE